jgi:hypothetical protein
LQLHKKNEASSQCKTFEMKSNVPREVESWPLI